MSGNDDNVRLFRHRYIWKIVRRCDGNISEAARVLGIHRRSLQRMLHKMPPPDETSDVETSSTEQL